SEAQRPVIGDGLLEVADRDDHVVERELHSSTLTPVRFTKSLQRSYCSYAYLSSVGPSVAITSKPASVSAFDTSGARSAAWKSCESLATVPGGVAAGAKMP